MNWVLYGVAGDEIGRFTADEIRDIWKWFQMWIDPKSRTAILL